MKYSNDEIATLLALSMFGGIVEAIKEEEEKKEPITEEEDVPLADKVADFATYKAKKDNAVLDFSDFLNLSTTEEKEDAAVTIPEGHVSLELEGIKISGNKNDVIEILHKLSNEFPMKG